MICVSHEQNCHIMKSLKLDSSFLLVKGVVMIKKLMIQDRHKKIGHVEPNILQLKMYRLYHQPVFQQILMDMIPQIIQKKETLPEVSIMLR